MRGPERLLIAVGIVVGLAFALLSPPWAAGADEATHFARALEMAHRRLTPGEVDGRVGSPIPSSYRADEDDMILLIYAGGPFGTSEFEQLRESRPDWSVTDVVETQPTLAATPFAYAPSALAMAVPDRLGWAGIWVLWAGRIGNLLVYLAAAWLAVRVATAFRWTLAIAALFPMNLGIAASITPDALTIAAFLLVVAVWTRVWRPVPADATGSAGEAADDQARTRERALAPLGSLADDAVAPLVTFDEPPSATEGVDGAGAPGRGRIARLGDWTRTPLGTGVMVLVAGLLLVATKPPYFLVLVVFPALLVTAWRDRRVRAAALGAVVALATGTVFTLLSSSGSYKAVTLTLGGDITYQPEVQQQRLLGDPIGFLGRVISNWFGNLDVTVQRWVRHVGYVEVSMPSWASWAFVVVVIVAAMALDRRDLLGLRRIPRAIWALAALFMVLALYASSYLYFDDTVEGTRMGLQIARYVSPIFAAALIGWAPRFPLRAPWSDRIPVWIPVAAVVLVELAVIVLSVRTWSVVGWSVDTS